MRELVCPHEGGVHVIQHHSVDSTSNISIHTAFFRAVENRPRRMRQCIEGEPSLGILSLCNRWWIPGLDTQILNNMERSVGQCRDQSVQFWEVCKTWNGMKSRRISRGFLSYQSNDAVPRPIPRCGNLRLGEEFEIARVAWYEYRLWKGVGNIEDQMISTTYTPSMYRNPFKKGNGITVSLIHQPRVTLNCYFDVVFRSERTKVRLLEPLRNRD